MKTALRALVVVLATLTAAAVWAVVSLPSTADAVVGSQFNAGYIISDANFFNFGTMTPASIESFLQGQERGCAPAGGIPCLENFTETTTTRAAAANGCAAYTGAPNESAATIIWKVAQACRINPQVLLVTLQKEEGLVQSKTPSAGAYKIAMGYACPDTAPCDSLYFGFYNQVYSAAWQFRQYTYAPSGRRYHVGASSVQFSPNAACGSSTVNILDQATANLYLYTPYQPNTAALNHLTGTGDGCSSYGNRNFWYYYWSWFGDPTGNSQPNGVIDNITAIPGGVDFTGWVFDPDTTDPINVRVSVDGVVGWDQPANSVKAGLGAAFPAYGDNHGYTGIITGLSAATHTVCVLAVNVSFGADSQLGCRVVPQFTGSPLGVIDTATGVPGAITVTGWMLDPDSLGPVTVNATVDGHAAGSGSASAVKTGLDAAFPGYGDNHDFSITISSLSGGTHTVCVNATNIGPGTDSAPTCRAVAIPTGAPYGVIDSVSTAPNTVAMTGWMLDPDTVGAIQVNEYVDGQSVGTITANGDKPGLDAAFPGYGDNHDFAVNLTTLTGGTHTVCVAGVNVGAGGAGAKVCRVVTVPTGPPFGVIDSTTAVPNSFTVTGWMLDPDSISPIQVQVYVDGRLSTTVSASGIKAGLGSAFPGYGDDHDYTASVTSLPGGPHSVCVVGVNVGPGSNSASICKTVVVPTGPPLGVIDSTSTVPNSITVTGWMLDPDSIGPINVQVYVAGVLKTTVSANGPKADLDAAFPGYGDNHDFVATVTGSWTGAQQVCVKGLNVGGGSDSGLVCQTAQMPTGSPYGVIDSINTEPNTIIVGGWMLDPDIAGPVQVQVYVGGALQSTVTASGVKSGLGVVFPGYGDNHGYVATVTGNWTGAQQVCVQAINVGGGSNSALVCQTAQMPTGAPFGVIDQVTPSAGAIAINGWVIDPDVATPISVKITVDGVLAATYLAGGVKAGLGTTFPGYGDNHDYSGVITGLSSGTHTVCGLIPNVGPAAADGATGCKTVVVP